MNTSLARRYVARMRDIRRHPGIEVALEQRQLGLGLGRRRHPFLVLDLGVLLWYQLEVLGAEATTSVVTVICLSCRSHGSNH